LELRLDRAEVETKGRPLAIHLAVACLRVLEDYRRVFGDIDQIAIVAAVAALQSDSATAAPTITAIAEAAGFTRETTRRKILRLTADRSLRKEESGGISISPALVERPGFMGAVRRQNRIVARLIDAFIDLDVVRLEAAAPLSGGVVDTETRLQPIGELSPAAAWSLAMELGATMHRVLSAYRRVAGTIDDVLIQLAVVVITSQHLVRDELEDELSDLRQVIPAHRLGVCNVSSVAAASGLPLETTRRKTLAMVEQGTLRRDASGDLQFATGALQRPEVYDLILEHTSDVTALANRLLRLGTLVPVAIGAATPAD
jgi:hypothetical protein